LFLKRRLLRVTKVRAVEKEDKAEDEAPEDEEEDIFLGKGVLQSP
jgi:hypothetical protein